MTIIIWLKIENINFIINTIIRIEKISYYYSFLLSLKYWIK